MKINVKDLFFHRAPFRWSQVWQSFAVEVATDDEAACFELMDGPNKGDASDDDDKCFCDYSSYSVYGTLCDINCTLHYSAAVSAVVPCGALMSALYSKAFRKHRIDGKRSMAEATTVDSTRFLRCRHCLIHDFQFLFRFQPQIWISVKNLFVRFIHFGSNFHTIFESRFGDEVGETAPGNKRK